MVLKPDLPAIAGLDKVFIGGTWRESKGGVETDIICPGDEEFLTTVVTPSTTDADAAVAAARLHPHVRFEFVGRPQLDGDWRSTASCT